MTLRLIGTDRTLERGAVNVYLASDGMAYVGPVEAPLDTRGVPMGLRQAPCGIEAAAARHCKAHRFHSMLKAHPELCSKDFRPVRSRKARVA